MFLRSINGSSAKPLKADYGTPKYSAVMGNKRGLIGGMPYVLGSNPRMTTAGFVPPPQDPYYHSVRALLHFEGADLSTTFTDEVNHTFAQSGSGAFITTADFKFGLASGSFDRTTVPYPKAPVTVGDVLGSQDWTIEAWIKPSGSNYFGWLSWDSDPIGALGVGSVQMSQDGHVVLTGASPQSPLTNLSPGSYTPGVWTHRAIVRNGTAVTTYADGISADTATLTAGKILYSPSSGYVLLGRSAPTLGGAFDGLLDELRVTVGVARYTADFTPPTGPFPNP